VFPYFSARVKRLNEHVYLDSSFDPSLRKKDEIPSKLKDTLGVFPYFSARVKRLNEHVYFLSTFLFEW
ncbi:MAG: hypothetical protein RSD58_08830, partial [Carnobacterium sp.]